MGLNPYTGFRPISTGISVTILDVLYVIYIIITPKMNQYD